MLDSWERMAVDQPIEQVESHGGDARAKLRRLFSLGTASAGDLLRLELAIRDWARRDKTVARRLRRVDNRRMAYMRSLFSQFYPDEDDVEARCILAFSLFIGSHFIAADNEPHSRRQALELAAGRLI